MRIMAVICSILLLLVVPATLANSLTSCGPIPEKVIHYAKPKPQRVRRPAYQPSVMMYQGSLRHNIVRIGHDFGWDTVVWGAPDDYLWVGQARITSNNLSGILNKILANYPLQARFYQGNHVLAIVPRNLP